MSILLVNGNSLSVPLADESVHCVVTSPPYWGLRDYGTATWQGGDAECDHKPVSDNSQQAATSTLGGSKRNVGNALSGFKDTCGKCGAIRVDGQLGLERTPDCGSWARSNQEGEPYIAYKEDWDEDADGNQVMVGLIPYIAYNGDKKYHGCGECYVCRMVAVFREVWRVLRKDGCVFLNLGDSYSGSSMTGGNNGINAQGTYKKERQFKKLSGVQRAKTYDTSGKAPEGYQDRGCLCGSLCDACRTAYRIGKSHSDSRRAPMQSALLYDSTREHTELQSAHLPTLGSSLRADHSATAIPDPVHLQDHEYAQPPASQVSRIDESYQQLQGDSRQSDNSSFCLLCGKPLERNAPVSSHTLGDYEVQHSHIQDNELHGDQLERRNQYKDKACEYCGDNETYPYYTTASRLKPKDLVGIPWRVAFALQADGWYLRSDIIWSKPNPMPESVTDRPTKAHEYLFLLAKAQRYYYDADAVREPQQEPWRSTGEAETGGRIGNTQGMKHIFDRREYNPAGRNRRTVWEIATQPYSGAHFATFPEKLVEPCIKAGTSERGVCPVCGKGWRRVVETSERIRHESEYQTIASGRGDGGDRSKHAPPPERKETGWQSACSHDADPIPAVVFDPFAGSGTTLVVARKLGRHGVGLDLSRKYLAENARARLELDKWDAWVKP